MPSRPPGFAAALLWAAATSLAHGTPVPGRLAVSLLQDEARTVRVQVRVAAAMEPDLGWSGTALPLPYRLVLAWSGPELGLDQPLPELPAGGFGPVRSMTLERAQGRTQLVLELDQAVQPSLRRHGDAWVLRLLAAPQPAAPASTASAAAVAAPSAPPEQSRQVAMLAAPPPTRPARADRKPAAEVLLLDMTVNGQRLPGLAHAERRPDGVVLLAQSAWTEARLAAPGTAGTLTDGTPAHALDTVAGLTWRIDASTLALEVNAPASAFVGSTLGPKGPLAVAPRRDPGAMLNYDVSLAHDGADGLVTAAASLEAVAFGSFGHVVASALVRDDGQRRSFTRLDTYWRYDIPEAMQTLVVGDTVGTGGGWSPPVRYGGIRWGRDFGMRPGFVTMPQLALAGQAALPSTVDVMVNNALRSSQPVAPGPFDLSGVPVVTGAGEVSLVVRDLLGRETVVRQSYYASPRLLAPGLVDFSAEAGWLRTGWGLDSHYGDAFAAGTVRAGLTPGITGEGRIELQPHRRAGGVDLAALLGQWGVGRAALAASSGSGQGRHEQGRMLQLGVERSTATGGGTLQYEYATRGFQPFGEAAGQASAGRRTRESWLASLGGPVLGSLTGALSYVQQTRWDGERVASIGLFLTAPVAGGASIGLALSKRLDGDGAWSAGVNLTLPLDNGVHTAARAERQSDGRMVGSAAAALNPPAGNGLGWRVEASTQDSQRARGGLQVNTGMADLAADAVANARGQVAVRAGARGTVGIMDGVPFAARPVGEGSFAMVEVEGVAGVPVMRSNQVVAHTDARGRAFVPGLLPWQQNQIEIDPAELPMDVELADTVREVTPFARSGATVKFGARRSRQALVSLEQADGQPVPLGTRVRLGPDGPEFIAGRRGEVWLTDLAAGPQALQARWPSGGCELTLEVPATNDSLPGRIGPLRCAGASP